MYTRGDNLPMWTPFRQETRGLLRESTTDVTHPTQLGVLGPTVYPSGQGPGRLPYNSTHHLDDDLFLPKR